jgi:hypothetical protein
MGESPIGAREAYAEILSVGDDIDQYHRRRASRAGGPDPDPQPGGQPPVHEPPPFPDDEPPHDEPQEDPPPVRHERHGSIGFRLHAPASYQSRPAV